jgi:hypothetical protein
MMSFRDFQTRLTSEAPFETLLLLLLLLLLLCCCCCLAGSAVVERGTTSVRVLALAGMAGKETAKACKETDERM